jgi:hypothetical protein
MDDDETAGTPPPLNGAMEVSAPERLMAKARMLAEVLVVAKRPALTEMAGTVVGAILPMHGWIGSRGI